MTKAAITPGTQQIKVSNKTRRIDPHPLSITARGGKMIQIIALKSDIVSVLHLQQKHHLSFVQFLASDHLRLSWMEIR